MVLAGGRGNRLQPLTGYRSKPAVPFGGSYRIVDFVLSNLVNSGIRSVYVLTQFKSQSLTEHLHRAWAGLHVHAGHFVIPVPAQMQTAGELWYEGTADAIYQNLNLVRDTHPDLVCVFGGDHIYYMNVAHMLRRHVESGADVSIAGFPVPVADAHRFGVMEVGDGGRVFGFHEKAAAPPTMPGDPARCYASMGNYVFARAVLEEMLERDAADSGSSHDFGKDVLPRMVTEGRNVFAYDFETNPIPGNPEGQRNTYWRDVGTLQAYFDANMDLKEVVPQLDLYNREWRIQTVPSSAAPAKFVHASDGRTGEAIQSIVAAGTIVSGASIRDSVVSRNVRLHSYATVTESILMDGVVVGRKCKVHRAIIDKDVRLEPGTTVGVDPAADAARGWFVSETGITVIPKNPMVRPVTTIDL